MGKCTLSLRTEKNVLKLSDAMIKRTKKNGASQAEIDEKKQTRYSRVVYDKL